jgi:hypothetical protein
MVPEMMRTDVLTAPIVSALSSFITTPAGDFGPTIHQVENVRQPARAVALLHGRRSALDVEAEELHSVMIPLSS